jgi:hypothetical protein
MRKKNSFLDLASARAIFAMAHSERTRRQRLPNIVAMGQGCGLARAPHMEFKCEERSARRAEPEPSIRFQVSPACLPGLHCPEPTDSKCAEIDRLAIAGSDSWAWNVRAGTRATRGASFTISVAILSFCTLRGSTSAMSE